MMKKLHVLNIAFQNQSKIPTLEQFGSSSQQSVELAFCMELLQLMSMKGKQQLEFFKQSMTERTLRKLIHVLKRYRKLEMENLLRKGETVDYKKDKAQIVDVGRKNGNRENSNQRKDFLATIDYLKQEISQKNKKIAQQQTKIVRLTNKSKLPADKFTRDALMDKLNIYGQDQLKKMMVDVKSFHEKGNRTLESKRDSKSAMTHKKILKRSKLFVKKSFILQNKENNFEKINLKFNKKEKNFEKLNEVAQQTKCSQLTDQNNNFKGDKIQNQYLKTDSLSFGQVSNHDDV